MSTYEDTRRDDAPAPEGTELCSTCKQRKPFSEFYADKAAAAHHFRRYDCKQCSKAASRASDKQVRERRRDKKLALTSTGVRLHVGYGTVAQDRRVAVVTGANGSRPPDTEVVLPPEAVAADRDSMSLHEWLELGECPSIFVHARLAIQMRLSTSDDLELELLTLSGDGPKERLTGAMVRYLTRLLTGQQDDKVFGWVYY
jgi:hypothetical protein